MNNQISDLIEKHGPELAEKLKIATEAVYDKVLWFVRIKGILNLSSLLVISLIVVIEYAILTKLLKQAFKDCDSETIIFSYVLGSFVFLLIDLLIFFFVDSLVQNIAMIAAPEYYLINEIISKVN